MAHCFQKKSVKKQQKRAIERLKAFADLRSGAEKMSSTTINASDSGTRAAARNAL
jgi:transcription elongation factor Elf1